MPADCDTGFPGCFGIISSDLLLRCGKIAGKPIEEDWDGGAVSDAARRHLATKVFEHTAAYDGAIANYLGRRSGNDQSPKYDPFRKRGAEETGEDKVIALPDRGPQASRGGRASR